MDRNFVPFDVIRPAIVALRKESVDRNFVPFDVIRPAIVALRKESVDRNSRSGAYSPDGSGVALRKESVDRNSTKLASFRACISRSPQGERG